MVAMKVISTFLEGCGMAYSFSFFIKEWPLTHGIKLALELFTFGHGCFAYGTHGTTLSWFFFTEPVRFCVKLLLTSFYATTLSLFFDPEAFQFFFL